MLQRNHYTDYWLSLVHLPSLNSGLQLRCLKKETCFLSVRTNLCLNPNQANLLCSRYLRVYYESLNQRYTFKKRAVTNYLSIDILTRNHNCLVRKSSLACVPISFHSSVQLCSSYSSEKLGISPLELKEQCQKHAKYEDANVDFENTILSHTKEISTRPAQRRYVACGHQFPWFWMAPLRAENSWGVACKRVATAGSKILHCSFSRVSFCLSHTNFSARQNQPPLTAPNL